jgi:signal transduction histidine kinase
VKSKRNESLKIPSFLIYLIATCMVIGLALGVFYFVHSYAQLQEELKQERIVYVNEISSQISTSIYNRRDRLLQQISSAASSLDYMEVHTFEDVRKLFKDKLDDNYTIVLCDAEGRSVDLNSNSYPLRNNDKVGEVLDASEAQYFFEKSTSGIDYWVFGKTITPKEIDGYHFVAVFELYNVSQFQSAFSLDLFDDVGMGMIVNNDSSLRLKSDHDSIGLGYNALQTFAKLGLEQETVKKIQTDMRNGTNGKLYVTFDDANWILDYQKIEGSDEYVLVIVPIAVTSAGVTQNLRATLLAVGIIIGCISMLLILFVLRNTQMAKQRNKQLYELELRSKTVESKNDFLAKMSHDIRTPLNAIIGMNYIATTQVEETEPVMDSLIRIDTSAKYLLNILNDVLDMSKIESGKMELNLAEFRMDNLLTTLCTIVETQSKEKDIQFTMKIDPQVTGYYLGDALHINQILMNLISNALKFTSENGHISVDVESQERIADTQYIRFSVTDDGIGMTEEFMKNIFSPFTQDGADISHKYGGSGLGLSIVKNFVDMMGGTIRVHSKKDEGSTFTILLPLKMIDKPVAEQKKPIEIVDESILVGKRILLVEDNAINMMIAKKILMMLKMTVEEVVNGKLALELFEAKPAGYYSIIVTDIRMPEMDGYELTTHIRNSKHPDASMIPIIAMSANAFDEDIKKSLAQGMNAHLKKPIDVAELKLVLSTYIRKEPPNEK